MLLQDVPGNQLVDILAQVNGTIDTLGGQISYTNTARRFGWGIDIAHLPQTNDFLLPTAAITIPGADAALVQQQVFTEVADIQGSYPLSANRRIEALAGYQHVWFEQTAPVSFFQQGNYVGGDMVTLDVPPPLPPSAANLLAQIATFTSPPGQAVPHRPPSYTRSAPRGWSCRAR